MITDTISGTITDIDISTLCKSDLQSEISALNYIDYFTVWDTMYNNELREEYCRRIEGECKNN